jgi:hypothetical protein
MGGALEVALEGVESAGQLGAVGLEPLVELAKGFGAQAVEPALGIAADLDQAGVAQHLEVPRHARLVHADGVDELAHRALPLPYGVEDATTSRFGDDVEDGELARHRIIIRTDVYMGKWMVSSAGSARPGETDEGRGSLGDVGARSERP